MALHKAIQSHTQLYRVIQSYTVCFAQLYRAILIIIIIITLFNEGKDIDYWSPSSFHNGPPEIKSTLFKSLIYNRLSTNQIKCWFLVRGENRSTRGKTSHSRVENQQTQSTYDTECGNRTQATLVEGKCSHH